MAATTRRPRYLKMNGILYPEMFSPKCFKEALEYKPDRSDVFICTYPKCGTTWMQNVAMYIFRKGKEVEDKYELMKLAPFIDMLGKEGIDNMPRPGAFKTHLPYSHMPYSPEAKYVFVARNPKDCCVSFYYHSRNHPGLEFWDGEFDDFFELFLAGELGYNDYFDHLLEWYPHRNDPNVFYTTYEDMKKDIKSIILRLSTFFGKEYIETIERDNAVLSNIIHYSGFDYMKKAMSELCDKRWNTEPKYEGLKYLNQFAASLNPPHGFLESQFTRNGIVGDWKNHFSPEQTKRLDSKFLEKMRDTDVLQWYPLT